jgi:tight adherence protein C
MTPVYLLSVQLSVFFATALLLVWFMTRSTPAAKRLYNVTRLVPVSVHRPSQTTRSAQVVAFRFLHRIFRRIGITVNDKLRTRFRAAGLRSQNSMDVYFAVRLLLPVALLVTWTFYRQVGFFPITLMAAGAHLGPDLWLTARTKRRREQIRLGLPDALDLMVVCVDAGLGLDQVLLRTGQELVTSHPVIAEEFMLINLEQRAGKPRINAWRDMADRTQLGRVNTNAGPRRSGRS